MADEPGRGRGAGPFATSGRKRKVQTVTPGYPPMVGTDWQTVDHVTGDERGAAVPTRVPAVLKPKQFVVVIVVRNQYE
jgi:hypothetical protein